MEFTMADDPKVKAALESVKKAGWPSGKPHSEETKKKISESHKGKPMPESAKQKLREAMKGNHNKKGIKVKKMKERKPLFSSNEILYCVEAYGKAIRDGMDGVAEKWSQIAHSFVDDLLLKAKTVAKGHIVQAEKLSETRKRGRPRKNVEETEQPKKKRHRRTKAEMEAYRASLAAQTQTETNTMEKKCHE